MASSSAVEPSSSAVDPSSSAVDPSSTMEETRNWLEMPHEIMGGMILQRIGAIEIFKSAQKVCTTWRRICKDPSMWKIIDIHQPLENWGDWDNWEPHREIEKLTMAAVNRSCGELIDISIEFCGTDDLLDYISRCSSKLKSLRIMTCFELTSFGLIQALKRLPHLETLELNGISISIEHIEVIGQTCPQLKSFDWSPVSVDRDGGYGRAIANSMPALCHLRLFCITINNDGLQAILHGCPHLESLNLLNCFSVNLGENLVKLCRERIKDFKRPEL